jgi:hypothetical protein
VTADDLQRELDALLTRLKDDRIPERVRQEIIDILGCAMEAVGQTLSTLRDPDDGA